MNEQELNQRFDNIMQPQVVGNPIIKVKRLPAKYPELRYLWGMTLLGSFILIVIASVFSTIIEAL